MYKKSGPDVNKVLSIKEVRKVLTILDPRLPLHSHILALHSQKLTVAYTFARPHLPLSLGRPF